MKKIILTFTVYFSTTSLSHAYLDPGTGSAILQALIAALAACGVMMSNSWKKMKGVCLKILPFKKYKKTNTK